MNIDMKTLQESILNSTKSGKNTEITTEYLINRGYKRKAGYGNYEWFCPKGKITDVDGLQHRISDNEFSFRFRMNNRNYKSTVKTIADLEFIEEYWKIVEKELNKSLEKIISNVETIVL